MTSEKKNPSRRFSRREQRYSMLLNDKITSQSSELELYSTSRSSRVRPRLSLLKIFIVKIFLF